MARFLQAPQQQVIPMYQPLNLEFYSGILNKAQQDLERSTAIKASAIEKLYDIPFSSKEDADAVVGRVQELLKGATDADFVSPSKVTNAVMKANAEVMPGIQAAKAKAQAADMYDKMRIQYGPNAWMGTDPRSIGIMQGGKYVDPSTFKAVGIDASELDKVFLASQLSELTKQGEPTYSASKLPGYYQERQTTGMSDADREATYRPGTAKAIQLAEEQLKSMPQVLEIFGGDREKALEQLQMRNYQTTGAYKQTIDTRLVDNKNYLNAYERARLNASSGTGGTPTTLFKPQDSDVEQVDTVNEALSGHLGKDAKMSISEIMFDESGKLLPIRPVSSPAGYTPYAGSSGSLRASTSEKIDAHTKNIAQTKLLTSMRKDLHDQKINIIKDSKTGKYRARTDKEVYEFYTTAVNNSANVFGKSFQINPGLDIIGANAFFYPDGRRKEFKDVNIEVNNNDGKGWQPVDETNLAEELGYDIKDGEGVKSFNNTLRTLGSDSYDFMSGDAKVRTAMTNKDGKEISLRYNAPPEVRDYKKPVAQLYNAFVKPVKNEKVYLADSETGRPVEITLNSKFASYGGRPVIYPTADIDVSTPTGQIYKQIYDAGGYEALLAQIQQDTDNALMNTGNVYVRKAVNVKDIPE